MYLPAERISVVVMFNHLSDAQAAALDLLSAMLGEHRPRTPEATTPAPHFLGTYMESETGLSARVDAVAPAGEVRLRFGHSAERLELQADGTASNGSVQLRQADGELWMDRAVENQSSRLRPCEDRSGPAGDVAGRYRCAELDAELTVADAGGGLYGGFSGFLGQGRMELLDPIGKDVWALPCPRALDHTPPGDWTLAFQRNDSGGVAGVDVGCWLARRLAYVRCD